MDISNSDFERANARAEKKQTYKATSVKFDTQVSRIVISLVSGLDIAFSPQHAQGLENAAPDDLQDIEISPSGLGLHFPKLDADIYIPALLEGFLGSSKWIAAKGGRVSSPKKAEAARANGKLGGRPKKVAA